MIRVGGFAGLQSFGVTRRPWCDATGCRVCVKLRCFARRGGANVSGRNSAYRLEARGEQHCALMEPARGYSGAGRQAKSACLRRGRRNRRTRRKNNRKKNRNQFRSIALSGTHGNDASLAFSAPYSSSASSWCHWTRAFGGAMLRALRVREVCSESRTIRLRLTAPLHGKNSRSPTSRIARFGKTNPQNLIRQDLL